MVMISINEYLDLWLDNEITSYITYAIGLFGTLQLIVESPMESAEKNNRILHLFQNQHIHAVENINMINLKLTENWCDKNQIALIIDKVQNNNYFETNSRYISYDDHLQAIRIRKSSGKSYFRQCNPLSNSADNFLKITSIEKQSVSAVCIFNKT